MDAIDVVSNMPNGTRFTHRGRTYTRTSGCTSSYGPMSKGGERYVVPVFPEGKTQRMLTVRPHDTITVAT